MECVAASPTSSVLRFGLPDRQQPLNLSTCACILSTATIRGETITRPYTPISTNHQVGSFDLLVKHYEAGTMSKHLKEIQPGDQLGFSHIPVNVKIQAPFPYEEIGMLAGGTGITPMIQALHAILGDHDDGTKVTLLYGSRDQGDILGRRLLDHWAADYSDRLTVVHVLSDEPVDSNWTGARGHIGADLVSEHFPPPSHSVGVFICGPPPMYQALCGPRDEKQVSGVLKDLGYSAEQVYKF